MIRGSPRLKAESEIISGPPARMGMEHGTGQTQPCTRWPGGRAGLVRSERATSEPLMCFERSLLLRKWHQGQIPATLIISRMLQRRNAAWGVMVCSRLSRSPAIRSADRSIMTNRRDRLDLTSSRFAMRGSRCPHFFGIQAVWEKSWPNPWWAVDVRQSIPNPR